MKAATYTRVSTDDQRDGASLDVQRERCLAYAEAQGWTVESEFSDPGVSGATFYERDGLLSALAAAQRDEIEILVAYNLDRFSRGVWPQLTSAAAEAGLRLVTADGVIDTADDDRELPADMYEAFAKEQRRMTVKKSMASRAQRVRSGNWVGGVAPYGHAIEKGDNGSKLVVSEEEREVMELAFAWILDEGLQPLEAANRLNAQGFTKRGRRWTSRSLVQSLTRTTLAGRFVYGKDHRAKTRYDADRYGIKGHEIAVSPVVSEARWAAMQQLLGKTKWKKQTSHDYPLTGRLHTQDGHTYTGRWDTTREKRRYRCRDRYDQSSAGKEGTHCGHKEIDADAIEAAIWWALEDEFQTIDRFYELLDELDDAPVDAEAAAQARDQHSTRIKKLKEDRIKIEARALREGFSRESVAAALAEIDADLVTVESELASAEAWFTNAVERDSQLEVLSSWQRMRDLFDKPDLATVKRVYEAIDLHVTLKEGGEAEVQVNLPLDVGLETIVSAPTSRRRRRARHARRRSAGPRTGRARCACGRGGRGRPGVPRHASASDPGLGRAASARRAQPRASAPDGRPGEAA
jgi:site-specific DNA recombinase